MAIKEHVEIVKQGKDAIAEFRKSGPTMPLDLSLADLSGADLSGVDLNHADLSGANLSGVDLSGADLSHADLIDVDLSGADLNHANLSAANLSGADLNGADLSGVDLSGADLSHADLSTAELSRAVLSDSDLSGANLSSVNLYGADLIEADLSYANLKEAILSETNLSEADLSYANLSYANLSDTVFRLGSLAGVSLNDAAVGYSTFAGVSLGEARGLESVRFVGPSYLDAHTLRASKGKIPESFLRGVGFSPWEVLNAKLYDPLLKPAQIAEINNAIYQKRVGNPVGGVFISYSHADSEFVERLHAALDEEKYSVWRDAHDLVAGPLERQVFDAIRINDVVLLVLSEHSVKSDWIEAELEAACDKEKSEGRPVLCPITLDDAWEAKLKEENQKVLWRKVKEKVVLDFGGWDADGFDDAFAKLHKGLPRYYGASKASD